MRVLFADARELVRDARAGALQCAGVINLDELTDVIVEEVRAQHAVHLEPVKRWDEIRALPQLFLGVG